LPPEKALFSIIYKNPYFFSPFVVKTTYLSN